MKKGELVKLLTEEIRRRLRELELYDDSSAGYGFILSQIKSEQEFLNNMLSKLQD
jgi:hypothetical protein